jgi:succinate-semialdehyde dehydrogenase/glutarate-semialdehyde dehydrogenase
VEGALLSKFRNAGQTCVCANRMFVHEKHYDAFRDKLVAKVRGVDTGRPLAEMAVGSGALRVTERGPAC